MMRSKIASRPACSLAVERILKGHANCGRGIAVLLGTLVFLSIFLGINFDAGRHLYVEGQVADSDVVADRFMLVEDQKATHAREEQVMQLQPPVYDLSIEPYMQFEQRLIDLMREQNGVPAHASHDSPSAQFTNDIGPDLAKDILPELGMGPVQDFILKRLLPLLRARLCEGLVGDVRSARVGRGGVVIRNLDTGSETLRPDVTNLPDVQSFLMEIANVVRDSPQLSHNARRAINILLAASLPATLTLNREATQKRASAVVEKVEPVYYQIQKGEMIVRRGDRVSREQQIKLQTLYRTSALPFDWSESLGALLISLFMSAGFFLSPSGKTGSFVNSKDLCLISLVLVMTTLSARALYAFGYYLNSPTLTDAFCVAFPVAGAVGFSAMIFAARRYVTMGMLLTFFVAQTMQLSMSLVMFHFLSAMLSTWLVLNAVNRQDAVWNLLPLILGESVLLCAVLLLDDIALNEFPLLLTAVGINALTTLILFFSLSPVLEILFGYSTKFRLMEFMSLEQPLMQEIMVTIPGTYHHCLVVANMVEAGAKSIGANSLLCKVAALYHDVGKLQYPLYYIENQFGGPNKHDKLAPSMSALIIMNHVKKGVELCEQYKLGQEITDIIAQHHGTRSIRYFYQKAVNLGENPNESDYCYPGPRPQTREAAILMLADSVEASSRTLTDPTPARLKAHIDKIIKGIFAEGQLDESELTFRDLHYLSESFQRVLTGMFHQRIAYPGQTRRNGQTAPAADRAPAQGKSAQAARTEQGAGTGKRERTVPAGEGGATPVPLTETPAKAESAARPASAPGDGGQDNPTRSPGGKSGDAGSGMPDIEMPPISGEERT